MFSWNKCEERISLKMPFSSLIIISVWIIIELVAESAGFDYCKLGNDHTMCKYKQEKPGPKCGHGAKLSYPTQEEKDLCVRVHNELRSQIASGELEGKKCPSATNMLQMEWDDEVAKVAHRLIMQCQFGHDHNRNVARFYCGQNLFAFSHSSHFPDTKEMYEVGIRAWFSEIKNIDRNNLKKFGTGHGDVGHFTQLIWSSSKYVGCAAQNYKQKDGWYTVIVACNYGPGGNVVGVPTYEFGKMCSKCPDKHHCSASYLGLCTDKGPVGSNVRPRKSSTEKSSYASIFSTIIFPIVMLVV